MRPKNEASNCIECGTHRCTNFGGKHPNGSHPHGYYRTCQECGKTKSYASDYTVVKVTDRAHPHKKYEKCSVCDLELKVLAKSSKAAGCQQCQDDASKERPCSHSYNNLDEGRYTDHNSGHKRIKYCNKCKKDITQSERLNPNPTCKLCNPPKHTHSYGPVEKETSHPHRSYKKCSCGKEVTVLPENEGDNCIKCGTHRCTNFGGKHPNASHPHGYYVTCQECLKPTSYESDYTAVKITDKKHPHKIYEKCSVCDIELKVLDPSSKDAGCQQCQNETGTGGGNTSGGSTGGGNTGGGTTGGSTGGGTTGGSTTTCVHAYDSTDEGRYTDHNSGHRRLKYCKKCRKDILQPERLSPNPTCKLCKSATTNIPAVYKSTLETLPAGTIVFLEVNQTQFEGKLELVNGVKKLTFKNADALNYLDGRNPILTFDAEKYRELSTLSSESNMAYVYGFIKGIFQGLKDEVFEVVDMAKMALNFLDNGVSKVWKWLKGAAEFVVSLPDKVRRLRDVDFGDVLNAIKGVFSAIGNAISGMSNEDKGKALGYLIGGFLGDKIKGPLGAFGNALGGGPMGKFLKIMGNLSNAAFSAVSSSSTKLVDKIEGMFGISRGQVAALDDRLFKVLAKNGCFVAGTLVLTETGYKAIETVAVGERVYSRNIETGATELKTVYSTFSGLKAKFYKLHVAGEVIEATEEHPFWVSGYGWMTAKELKAGMQLVRKTGILEEIELITSYETNGTPIYNLAVADNHNYFVTLSNLLTHNLDCKKFNILYDSSGQLIKENLDALLAQVRSGKVTDAEYREIRELLVATKKNEKAVESLDNAMDAVKGMVNLSKANKKHILNRHSFSRVKQQIGQKIGKMSRSEIAQDIAERGFFNPEWTEDMITDASEAAYNQLLKQGNANGKYVVEVLGEEITVAIENGIFKTAWGHHKFTLDDFGY